MQKIPKIIHFCWFGDKEYSNIQNICFESWKIHLPDYEFILWNEDNSDMNHPFVKFAYEKKKFAFVADYIRLKAVYEYGGIYLDTDMFLMKNFDSLLDNFFFIGAQDSELVSAGIFGGLQKSEYIKTCLKYYEEESPMDWQLRLAIPRILTRGFETYAEKVMVNFSTITKAKDLVVYPPEYFYPLPFDINKPFQKDFVKFAKDETIAIHLWEGSWIEYDIFQLIRRRSYLEALRKIDFNKKLKIKFLKKCIISLLQSIKIR